MKKYPRVTGGFILGWNSKRPMAVADEPEEQISKDSVITYSAVPQICGFPWRISGSDSFSIGPLMGPQTGILASEIATSLVVPGSAGARIYLREYYYESVVSTGGAYYWGGGVEGGATAEIVIRAFEDTTDENVLPSLNSVTGAVTPATIMWQIAIVVCVDGQYYLCDTLNPPSKSAPMLATFPDDFDTENPL